MEGAPWEASHKGEGALSLLYRIVGVAAIFVAVYAAISLWP